jgi:EmrB/QacA subfamily drug resistance transporter
MAVSGKRIHYRATFAVLALAATAFSLMQSLVLPALPELERALHTSSTGVSWLLTANLLSAAIATPILGRLGDMTGKEKMLVVVLTALAIGTLICAVATSLDVLILGRTVQGAGGAVFPLAFGIIRDEFPPAQISTAIGIISSILGIGTGAGIVLAGPLVEHLSYHWLFWIPLVMIIVATVATFAFVPESPIKTPASVNWWGALLMSGWLTTGLLAISEAPIWGWSSPSVIVLLLVTAVLIGAWLRSEMRSAAPLIDMRMMRNQAVWTTNLAGLLFGFGMFSMFIIVPEFVQTPVVEGYGFGSSVTEAGFFLAPLAVAMLVIAPLTGRLSNAIGSKPLLVIGSMFGAASYALLALYHTHPWSIYVAAGLLGVGIALGFASMTNLIIGAVPPSQTGVATGMNANSRIIGGALGSSVAASIVASTLLPGGYPEESGFTAAFVVCSVAMTVAALAALAVPGRARSRSAHSSALLALTAEADVFTPDASAYSPEPPT